MKGNMSKPSLWQSMLLAGNTCFISAGSEPPPCIVVMFPTVFTTFRIWVLQSRDWLMYCSLYNAFCLTESHCHVVSTGSKNNHGAYSICPTCYCIWFLNYYQLQAQNSWLELACYHLERAWSTSQGSSACCWATSHVQFLAVTEPLPIFFHDTRNEVYHFLDKKKETA